MAPAAAAPQTNIAAGGGLISVVVQAVLNNVDILNNSLNDVIEVNINDSLNNALQNVLQNADIDVLNDSLNNVLNNLNIDVTDDRHHGDWRQCRGYCARGRRSCSTPSSSSNRLQTQPEGRRLSGGLAVSVTLQVRF